MIVQDTNEIKGGKYCLISIFSDFAILPVYSEDYSIGEGGGGLNKYFFYKQIYIEWILKHIPFP